MLMSWSTHGFKPISFYQVLVFWIEATVFLKECVKRVLSGFEPVNMIIAIHCSRSVPKSCKLKILLFNWTLLL